MFQPTWPSSGALKLAGGTAAPSYAVVVWVGGFFTLTFYSKSEVCIVSLFMHSSAAAYEGAAVPPTSINAPDDGQVGRNMWKY
jgi:hypothetical protein